MNKLFVDKKIVINTPASKVWEVITKREYNNQWAQEFSPGMFVESSWSLGDSVLWKEPDGKVVVEGNVTKVEPGKFLRFTLFDVEQGRHEPTGEEDGLTFELREENGKTNLHIIHGDFAVIPEGKKYYEMTLKSWEKILPKLKELSEKN